MYNEKCMKIKFKSDEEFPLIKMKEIPTMIIAVGAIFLETLYNL